MRTHRLAQCPSRTLRNDRAPQPVGIESSEDPVERPPYESQKQEHTTAGFLPPLIPIRKLVLGKGLVPLSRPGCAIDATRRPFSGRYALSVKPSRVLRPLPRPQISRRSIWCSGKDSNLHALRQGLLRPSCLPFHHPSGMLKRRNLGNPRPPMQA